MKIDRRKFLSLTGGAALFGLAGKASYEAFAAGEVDKAIGEHKAKTRWAMVIDLRILKDHPEEYDNIINACNLDHNVPKIDDERHEIKWVWKEDFHHAFIEQENFFYPNEVRHMNVILMCNHCDNPPCVNVCPTQATWKREEDGIVMMDWHRCIGCRYCMAACPYGSRSFNWVDPKPLLKEMNGDFPARTKGVVEKCTFCASRISQGKQPACVEACKTGALKFGNLYDRESEIRKVLRDNYSIRRKPELGTQPEVYYLI